MMTESECRELIERVRNRAQELLATLAEYKIEPSGGDIAFDLIALCDQLEARLSQPIEDAPKDGTAVAHQSALVGELVSALSAIRHRWAGHSEACAWAQCPRKGKCDCDWPMLEAQADAALAKAKETVTSDTLRLHLQQNGGRAIIEGGCIVIRIEIDALPLIVDGAWAAGGFDHRIKVTDAPLFAKELASTLNDEREDGTTRIHTMFDAAITHAFEYGAEGVESHEDQDIR